MTPESNPKNIGVYAIIVIALVVALIYFVNNAQSDKHSIGAKQPSYTDTQQNLEAPAQPSPNIVQLTQPLTTQYFEVTVQKYWVLKSVNTNNEYTDLPQLPDIKYLVLRIKYKNTDTESRMILTGDVLINYNGKDYNFDHPETILGEGWQTGLEQINPLTHLITAVVYKIPKELKGTAYYRPGRADAGQVIQIGEIK